MELHLLYVQTIVTVHCVVTVQCTLLCAQYNKLPVNAHCLHNSVHLL